MAKKKINKINEKVNAKELKDWLLGVLEFQTDTWSPNPAQWRTIKDKIFSLEETVPERKRSEVISAEPHISTRLEYAQSNPTIGELVDGGLDSNGLLSSENFPQLSPEDIRLKMQLAATSGANGAPRPNTNVLATFE